MARRNSGWLSFEGMHARALVIAALAALLLGPLQGRAARLSEVRVGTHSDHTRIVLQLDSAADYRMLSSGQDGQLVVALDAQSVARNVPSKSPLVKDVRVEPAGNGSKVHIALARPDIQVTEMILSNPPRIVFDLARGESAAPVAQAPAPKAEPAAAKQDAVVAKDSEPDGSTVPEAHGPPTAVVLAAPASAPMPAPSASPAPDAPSAAPSATDGKLADAAPPGAAKLADAPAHPIAPAPPSVPATTPPPASEPAAPTHVAPPPRHPPAAEASDSSSHWLLGTLMSPTGLVVIGAGLLAGIAMAVMRRRAAADEDPLYSVMAAEDAGEVEEDAGAAHWEATEPMTPDRNAQAFEAEAEESYEDLPLARLGSPAPPVAAGRSNGTILEGDAAASAMTIAAPVAASASGASQADVLRAAADVDGRVAELERRIEQLAEARERLERQVAAQTEELRVQRAAIARTQRVVRSMTKGDDLVTEPVPRSPNA
ncbi:MAG TPA: hypothetical protein VMH82_11430 [Myxococcota bacterium]|nr:hypothetical protein [Myxococcota bacterium]